MKIPYIKTATLDIVLTAGAMVDNHQWIPAHEHHSHFNLTYPAPYRFLSVKINLNDQLLGDSQMDKPVTLHHNFLDCKEPTSYCLKIVTQGFDEKFCHYVDGVGEVSPMIKIESIQIENLNMLHTMEDSGKCAYSGDPDSVSVPSVFIGQNGYQLLDFATPIYPWLLSNERKATYYYP